MKRRKEGGRGNRGPELLDVARRLFFQGAYDGTTMEKVARAAGFSKRTVYLYFKNKDDLFLTVAERGIVILRKRLEEIPITELGVEDAMASIVDVYLGFAEEHPRYFRIIFQEATSEMIRNCSEDVRERLGEHERACLGIVVSVVDKGLVEGIVTDVDPWDVATIFWGQATGIILLSMGGVQTMFTRKSREELVRQAVSTLFNGIRSHP